MTIDVKHRPNKKLQTGASHKATKKSQLIDLLSKGPAASLDKLSSALGWQRHTTSAAITRLKQEGYVITSDKPDGKARVYALRGAPIPGLKAARNTENNKGAKKPTNKAAKEAGSGDVV